MNGIVLENLSKSYKGETVLDGVSLTVPEGRMLVLFGPSGAGKTVLLRCIAGAVDPDAGKVILGGVDVTGFEPEDRGVGMAFQNFALFPHMTAEENIASPLKARRSTKTIVRQGVDAVARLLKIDHVLSHPPKALSNGQKQRTSLARALVAQPHYLLLDDPLRNVDAKLRYEMRLELPRLLADQGATVIYVTQDYKEAMAFGDHIAVLDGGRIVQAGTPEDIYLRPATIGISELFGDPTINLLDVVPERDERGIYITLSDQRIPLSDGYDAAVGKPCTLGLRPEALAFTDLETGIPVVIEAETPFNEKTVTLALTKRGREVLVSRPAGMPGPAEGESAFVSVNWRALLLFDRQNGQRIVPEGESGRTEAAA